MKKLLFTTLILTLLLSACCARAGNIFDDFEEEAPPAPPLTAPSYGAMANVEPDQVEPGADGSRIVTYRGVKGADVNTFGVYLGSLGFGVTGQDEQDGKKAYSVSDGQISFVMIYDPAGKTMQLIYPEGTDYAKALFPGYKRIDAAEELTIPGLGRIIFHPFMLNASVKAAEWFSKLSPYPRGIATNYYTSCLSFTFFNTSTKEVRYGNGTNHLFTAELVYRSEETVYTFEDLRYSHGVYLADERLIAFGNTYTNSGAFVNRPCQPLNTMEGAVAYALPEALRTSSDGTIAIKLDFMNGDKYVLMIRENGTDLFIAPPAQEE